MLRTNTKAVKAKIQNYIINNFCPDDYTSDPPQDFGEIAKFILQTFRGEKYSLKEDFRFYHNSEASAFEDWAAGLPGILNTANYYCSNSAVDILGDILEETEQEKAKYTETEAENLLTFLIYRELKKGAEK